MTHCKFPRLVGRAVALPSTAKKPLVVRSRHLSRRAAEATRLRLRGYLVAEAEARLLRVLVEQRPLWRRALVVLRMRLNRLHRARLLVRSLHKQIGFNEYFPVLVELALVRTVQGQPSANYRACLLKLVTLRLTRVRTPCWAGGRERHLRPCAPVVLLRFKDLAKPVQCQRQPRPIRLLQARPCRGL